MNQTDCGASVNQGKGHVFFLSPHRADNLRTFVMEVTTVIGLLNLIQ